MKEHLYHLLSSLSNPLEARNLAREYLQALSLQSLQRTGAMLSLAFHGGTALRFLYGSQRFSEDLDFSLEREASGYDFRSHLQSLRTDLEAQGYEISLKVSDQKNVHSAFVRFPGLLFDLGLSPHTQEVLAVKIEVDVRPPAGAGLEITLVRRHVLLRLQHHDPATLLAGKLHALLQRPFLKGRDLYDLIWYLSDPDWPSPNLVYLNNALLQTGWNGPPMTSENWRSRLRTHLHAVNWKQALADVQPFLQSPQDAALMTAGNLALLLGRS
jgi:hypothetical protein